MATPEFLEVMVQEPRVRSFPESVFKTLMFLEHAAKFLRVSSYAVRRQLRTHWKRLDKGGAIKNALEEAGQRLQSVEIALSK